MIIEPYQEIFCSNLIKNIYICFLFLLIYQTQEICRKILGFSKLTSYLYTVYQCDNLYNKTTLLLCGILVLSQIIFRRLYFQNFESRTYKAVQNEWKNIWGLSSGILNIKITFYEHFVRNYDFSSIFHKNTKTFHDLNF